MKVETVRAHQNSYGEKFEKAEGDEYSVADDLARQSLINAGLVKTVLPALISLKKRQLLAVAADEDVIVWTDDAGAERPIETGTVAQIIAAIEARRDAATA